MGLFSGDKTVNVSSVVYNLAGDITQRPGYLKSLVVRNVLSGTDASMAESIVNGLLNGPGIKLRGFYRWALRPEHYQFIGVCSGTVGGLKQLNDEDLDAAIASAVDLQPNQELDVQEATSGNADYSFWVEQWLGRNHPEELETGDWAATFDRDSHLVTVMLTDGSVYHFTAEDFSYQAQYVYAYYSVTTTTQVQNPDGTVTETKTVEGPLTFIYRVGSGNPLIDDLVPDSGEVGLFFPMIPVRINNNFLSEEYFKDAYHEAKRAYKKATGSTFDKLVDKIEDNESLDEIDYAYCVFGVCLNTLENSARRYLYAFFDRLRYLQVGGTGAGPSVGSSKIGGINAVQIQNVGAFFTGFVFRIEWASIVEGGGLGLGKPGAKVGQLWFETITYGQPGSETGGTSEKAKKFPGQGSQIRLYWQHEPGAYKFLDLYSLVHRNFIYGGYAVVITGPDALADNEESGFIVPLQPDVLRDMPLVHSTQMATACCYLMFNCFQVHRQQWYETWWFQVIIVVAVAIVSAVLTGGVGTVGILGSSIGIGSALGLSGVSAAIVGSVINGLAALILVSILDKVTTAAFGPLIGSLVSQLLMMGSSLFLSGNLASFSDLLKPENLLALTQSVGKIGETLIQLDTQDIIDQAKEYAEKAEAEMDRIQQMAIQEFGFGKGVIDPLSLSSLNGMELSESPATFLRRTLLTGMDIAEISNDLLSNYASYTLKLPDAFT